MTREELKNWMKQSIYNDYGLIPRLASETRFRNNFPVQHQEILAFTSFLPITVKFNERLYCVMHDVTEQPKCKHPDCQKLSRFVCYSIGYKPYCSAKCGASDPAVIAGIKATSIERYGKEHYSQTEEWKTRIEETSEQEYGKKYASQTEAFQEKVRQTNLETRGVECVLQDPVVKAKIAATNLREHGHENPFQFDYVKQTIEDNNMAKYGVKWHLSVPEVIAQGQQTSIERYGVKNWHQRNMDKGVLTKLEDEEWIKKRFSETEGSYFLIADELGVNPALVLNRFYKLGLLEKGHAPRSSAQEEVRAFIQNNYEGEILSNKRSVIPPLELDIYLPEKNLAIEFDGILYHSFTEQETPEQRNYHLNKTDRCNEKGIQLLHIFENEWKYQNGIWKSTILNKLGKSSRIFARKCQVQEVAQEDAMVFMQENHLQGYHKASVYMGLYHLGELVSCMLLEKEEQGQYEMVRFCSKKGFVVIGGASRLFQYFIRTYSPEGVIIEVNLRYSNGDVHQKMGIQQVGQRGPDYFYFKNGSYVLHRKDDLEDLVENYDPSKSEQDNMFDHGFRRIWDCGSLVYFWKSTPLQ